MTDKKVLEMYHKEIDATNRRIKSGLSWTKYAKKFKEINIELYEALSEINLTSIKNEYLRNWVRMLRNE